MCQRLYKCCVQRIAVENQIDKLVVVCIFQDNSNKELKIIISNIFPQNGGKETVL